MKRLAAVTALVLLLMGCASTVSGTPAARTGQPQTQPPTATEPTQTLTTPPATTAAPTTTAAAPTTTETSGFPGVGESVSFSDINGDGTVIINATRRIAQPESSFGDPPTFGTFLVIDVTITATTGTVNANPLYFRAQSNDGNTYDAELGVLENQLDSGDVTAGRQLRGEVAFDAPEGVLLIDYSVFGPPLATFEIP